MARGRVEVGAVPDENNTPVYTADLIDPYLGLGFAAIILDSPCQDKMFSDNFVVQYSATIELASDTDTLSIAVGNVNFTLAAVTDYANRDYLLLGGVSCTMPGTLLPDGVVFPLNCNLFTDLVVALVNTTQFADFLGLLDSYGIGSA